MCPLTPLSAPDTQHGGDLLPPYPWSKEEPPPFASCCPPGGPFGPPPPALLQGEAGGTHGTPELLPGTLPETGPPLGPPGPSSTCPVAPTEHLIPDLLVSPHMLPREQGAWGCIGVVMGWSWVWGGDVVAGRVGVAMGWRDRGGHGMEWPQGRWVRVAVLGWVQSGCGMDEGGQSWMGGWGWPAGAALGCSLAPADPVALRQ